LSFKNKFPYISEIDEVSNFKFGMQLEFAKAHHQIPPDEKVGVALSAMAKASNFKFSMQLGLAKAHHKNHNQRKK